MKLSRAIALAGFVVLAFQLPVTVEAKRPHSSPSDIVVLAPDEFEDSIVIDGQRVSLETGIPLAIYDPHYAVSPGTPEQMVQEYLRAHAEVFQLRSPTLDDLAHHHTRTGDAGHTVRYTQTHEGVPVYNADFTVTVNHQNTVIFVMNGYRSAIELDDVNADLAAAEARDIAYDHIHPTGDLVHESVELMVYHNQGVSHLVYRVSLAASVDPIGDWEILVDADSGQIVKAVDRAHYVDGTGSVFDADPLSSAGAQYGDPGYSDGNDADTPQLIAEIFTYPLLDITFNGLNYSLVGPWAEIRDFEGPFTGTFPQPTAEWDFTRSPQEFEASLTYWHLDNYMRYINLTLGTTCEPYQYPGGVRYDPHALNGADNSYYSSSTGAVAFGDGGVDDAEDSDVVVHELGHGIHDWLTVGGISQVNGLSEGFGDFVAQSYSRSLGQWDPTDPEYQWVFNWDGHNPFWGGRRTNWPATYPGGLTGQIHTDGQIFSTCLMRIWDEIGRERIDKAVFEGMAMTNGGTSQQGAAVAIMQAAISMNYTPTELASIYTNFTQTGYQVENPVAVGDAGSTPSVARLVSNRPNPFNPTTTIAYEVVQSGGVRLAIYDAAGRLVKELVNRDLTPGRYSLSWDGRSGDGHAVASGVYLIQLDAGGVTETRRAVLLK